MPLHHVEFAPVDGDTVMLCAHLKALWDSQKGIPYNWHRFIPGIQFRRDDDTEFLAQWVCACDHCDDPDGDFKADFVETVMAHGKLHAADQFHICAECRAKSVTLKDLL